LFSLDLEPNALTTNMILARRALGQLRGGDAAEWACEQLSSGLDTPHLRQLAGAPHAANSFELEELFDRTAREMGLDVLSTEGAVVVYAQELAREYIRAAVTREALLEDLCQLYTAHADVSRLQPFFLLRWTDFDFAHSGESHYYPGATKENFEEVLRSEIDALLGASE
jgi:hypothetical protein